MVNISFNPSLLAFDINYVPSSAFTKVNGNILLVILVRTDLWGDMASSYVPLDIILWSVDISEMINYLSKRFFFCI